MRSIAHGRTRWVEADRDLEPKHGGYLRCPFDREHSHLAPLDPADGGVRNPHHSAELTLAEPGFVAADKQLRAYAPYELPATTLTPVDGTIVRRHPSMVPIGAYVALI